MIRSKIFYIAFCLLIGSGIGVYYAIQAGFYPAAIVNSELISARRLMESSETLRYYYSQIAKSSGANFDQSPDVLKEVSRAVLDKMVEDALINDELKNKIGNNLSQLVENKFSSLDLSSKDFIQGVTTLYGVTVEKFKEMVLSPKAKQEILENEISAEKKDFSAWLKEARLSARVIILAPDLEWDGEKVVLR